MTRSFSAVFLVILGATCAAGCKHPEMATPPQCQSLLDHIVDLKLAEDPSTANLSPADRAARRTQITADLQTDSDVIQVKTQCTTQVTEAEYTCAIAAKTADRWSDCID